MRGSRQPAVSTAKIKKVEKKVADKGSSSSRRKSVGSKKDAVVEPPKQVFSSLRHFVTEATWDQKYSWCLDTINSLINREHAQTSVYTAILGPNKTRDIETGTSSSSSRPVLIGDEKPFATAGRGRRAAVTSKKKKSDNDKEDGSVIRKAKTTRRKKKNDENINDPRASGSESRQKGPLPGQPRRRRMPPQQQPPPEFDIHQVAMQPAEPQQRVIEPPTKKEPSTAHPQRGRSQRPPRARAPPTNTLPASPVEPTESPAPAPTPEDAPGSQEVMFARPLVKAAALAKQLSAASLNSPNESPPPPPAQPVSATTVSNKITGPVTKTRGGAKRKADPIAKATVDAKRAKTGQKDSATKAGRTNKKKSPSPDPLQPSLDGWVTKTPRKRLPFTE